MRYIETGYRIRQVGFRGFVIEKKVFKWYLFGIKSSWVHFISYSGISDKPYYFQSFESAVEDLQKELILELLDKFHNC